MQTISTGMSRLAQELAAIARDLGFLGRGETFPLKIHRVRAGYHQVSAGAWSWILVDIDGQEIMGSSWTATEIVAAYKEGFVTSSEHQNPPELFIEKALAVK